MRIRDDGRGLEAGFYVASLQGGVEDFCDHRRQLISTMLEGGGGDRVQSVCFAGVSFFKEPVDVFLQNKVGCH